ncbi:MAG: rhodanese-like domain-containing protein [Gammaproteobacteria bacterium]|nr:rhodanese-like domain-containing protein [Gammaproteobacteria bacterium]
MKRNNLAFLILLNAIMVSSVFAAADSFPGRAKYPEVAVVEKNQLINKMNDVVIIDTRSPLEFKTLRIKGARNIPVSSKTFVETIKELRKITNKPIVFYCNGRTCMKSYIASKQCLQAKIKDVSAYDAGMFEWAQTYPDQAELFGVSPVKASDIIPSAKFKSRLLTPEKFGYNIFNTGNRNVVLDVRDKFQRGAAGFFPGKESWISLDNEERLKNFIYKARNDNKTLYIYDEVGKQVRWLQYALESANMKNYYFMGKGARGYYATMMEEMGISTINLK